MSDSPGWFMYFIVVWAFLLAGFMAIGGYFMFRKFLKTMPLKDGKSKLDWQNYWVEASRHLWTDEARAFLDELVSPVPKPFRDTAKHAIAAKIGQIAVERGVPQITVDECVEGYILATPKRDHRYLKSFLEKRNIDYAAFRHLLK